MEAGIWKILASKIKTKSLHSYLHLYRVQKFICLALEPQKTNTARSDVDIAIDAGKLLPRTTIDEAHSVLQASNLMYRVDVVDLHQLDEEMRNAIMKKAIVWAH